MATRKEYGERVAALRGEATIDDFVARLAREWPEWPFSRQYWIKLEDGRVGRTWAKRLAEISGSDWFLDLPDDVEVELNEPGLLRLLALLREAVHVLEDAVAKADG